MRKHGDMPPLGAFPDRVFLEEFPWPAFVLGPHVKARECPKVQPPCSKGSSPISECSHDNGDIY